MEDNIGHSRLARVLQGRVNQRVNGIRRTIEFCTLSAGLSILTDDELVIPKSDYKIIETCSTLSKGDRVLVLWVDNTPIIIDKYKDGDA